MGRTNPTYRDRLRALEERWGDYRRGLRRRDRERFDRLFEYARAHADASGYLNHPDPIVAVLVSIAVEQEARIDALEAQLEADDRRAHRRASLADDQARLDECRGAGVDWHGDHGVPEGRSTDPKG